MRTPHLHGSGSTPLLSAGRLRLVVAAAAALLVLAAAPTRPQFEVSVGRHGTNGPAWWPSVSAELERQAYAPAPAPQGLAASNHAHRIRTTFGECGVAVLPRAAAGCAPAWRFVWETRGLGRASRMQAARPALPELDGARVVYRREGFSEWYENTKAGLEQGFTVDCRPDGDGALQVAGAFPHGLRPQVRVDGAVDFIDPHGACALRYGALRAWDANGVELASHLAVAAEELRIVVDDHAAAYPVTIDPLLTSPVWTVDGDQPFTGLGSTVSTAGDVNGDGFDDVIVGVPFHDNLDGWVFVYHGSAAGLAATPAWTQHGVSGSGFGASAASAGDVNGDGYGDIIIGAPVDESGQTDEGRAYVYLGSASGLAATPAWTAESNQAFAEFGTSVATAGNVNGDGYDDVIVGARYYDNGQVNEGRVFVYLGSATGLSATPGWTAESNVQGAYFGSSVATAGDVNGDGYDDVIVGAPFYSNVQSGEGGAFAYYGSAAGLGLTPAWNIESNQAGAALGGSVSTAGDVNGDGYSDVIVGAPQYDHGQNNEGEVFVFHGSASGLNIPVGWTMEVNQGAFGSSVATAGDVDNDGFSDVLIGAPGYGNGQPSEGAAFLYHGSATGLAITAEWSAEGNQTGADFGRCVAAAGDVNGDGVADVIVGAPSFDNGQEDEGRALVYRGTVDLVTSVVGSSPAALTCGDLDGDGILDLVICDRIAPLVSVFRGGGTSGAGDGTFAFWTQKTLASIPKQAVIADFNLDGFQDFAISHTGTSGSVSVFLHAGADFQLSTTTALLGATDGLATADIDQDGILDFVVCLTDSAGVANRGGVQFVRGGGSNGVWDGTFAAGSKHPTAGSLTNASARRVMIRDLNQDGFPDIIFSGLPRLCILRCIAGAISVCREFDSGAGGQGVVSGDFNEDGRLDLVRSAGNTLRIVSKSTVTVPQCSGGSWYTSPDSEYVLPSSPRAITALDWNQDGILDIAAAFDGLNSVQLYPGQGTAGVGDGTFGPPVTLAETDCWDLAVGDFVTNGSPDLIISRPQSGQVSVLQQTAAPGSGTSLAVVSPNGGEVWPLATASIPAERENLVRGGVEVAASGTCMLAGCSDVAPSPGTPQIAGVQQITWTKGARIHGVDVAVSRDNGVSWQTIAIDHPGTTMTWVVTPPGTQQARVRVSDTAVPGRTDVSDAAFSIPTAPTDVLPGAGSARIAAFTLQDPNPVRGVAHFSMAVPLAADVQVDVFDAAGRLVRTLMRGPVAAGHHAMVWDRRDAGGVLAPRGVYFVQARVGAFNVQRKLVAL